MADHTKVPVADVTGGKVGNRHTAAKFSSEEFADEAIEFLDGHTGDQPFFCYVAFTAPHDPRNPPEKYRAIYYKDRPPLPTNFRPLPAFDNGMTKGVRDEDLAPYPRTREVISDQLLRVLRPHHATWTSRSAGSWRRWRRAGTRRTRSSSTRPTTGWRWAATACSASRACTSTA